jgi:hypothetical protein
MPLCTPPIHLICYMYVPIAFVYCGGVTCACTCPKRRNINVVIQDSCTLSSSVNKCITICTPSIHLVVRLANPFTYLVSDAGTVKDSKSRHNLLVRRQEVRVVAVTVVVFYQLSCCIASYAIAIALFLYTSSSRTSSPFDIRFGIRVQFHK